MRDLRGVRTKVMTQVSVLNLRPRGAQLRDETGVVPIAVLAPETAAIDTAGRDHDVGVEIALIALLAGPVHGDVGDHALGDQVLLHKGADQVPALIKIKFVRQRQEDLLGGHGVLAPLRSLDGVPQGCAVPVGLRGVIWCHDFSVLDPVLVGEVKLHGQPVIAQRLA